MEILQQTKQTKISTLKKINPYPLGAQIFGWKDGGETESNKGKHLKDTVCWKMKSSKRKRGSKKEDQEVAGTL